jgi:transketolase
MRQAFAQALIAAARADERVIVLTGDHGYALFDGLGRACPGQYLNAGVAEQNMVGVAAGLAKGGVRPIVYGLSAFVPVRVLEQIKLDVCLEALPVVFIGDGAGVVYSTLGPSHQSAEDVAALRALPNLTILSPADAAEMTACMELALRTPGPVYLRMGKADLGDVHAGPPDLSDGLCPVRPPAGGRLAWLATGSMVRTALTVAAAWPGSSVWSVPCLKPLAEEQVAAICASHEVVVVLEEHSVYGGLGSAVAEVAAAHAPTWVCRIGVRDRFSERCGSYAYLLREHGLDAAAVAEEVRQFLARVPDRRARPRRTRKEKPAPCGKTCTPAS